MKKNDIITQQAILVALAELPASESAPLLDKSVTDDAISVVSRLRKPGSYEKFWQLYDNAFDVFTDRYHASPKDKVVRPTGNIKEASDQANLEAENMALPAAVVTDSFQRLDNIFQENPQDNAKKSFQQYSANLPKDLTTKQYTIYDWAEFMCRPC